MFYTHNCFPPCSQQGRHTIGNRKLSYQMRVVEGFLPLESIRVEEIASGGESGTHEPGRELVNETISRPFEIHDYFDTFHNVGVWLCHRLKLGERAIAVFSKKKGSLTDLDDVGDNRDVPFENATYLMRVTAGEKCVREFNVSLKFESDLFDE